MNTQEKKKFALDNPGFTYKQLAKVFGYKNSESARQFCKRHKIPNKRVNVQSRRTELDLSLQIAMLIKNKRYNLKELSDYFDVAPRIIEDAIKELKKNNVVIDNYTDGGFQLGKDLKPIDEPVEINNSKYKEQEFCIGFVADTHLGSKYERLDVLNALYDRFEDYGVKTVYHGGNWIDGEARFNKHDIYVHGVEAQIDNFLHKYPQRKGITTHIISGDDHEGWYVQREHINIGKTLVARAEAMGRNDIVDLGYMERDIKYSTKKGSSIVRVIHAGGGSSYATSYTSQKYAESLQGGEKPQIVLVGHYHKFNYSYPREIHMIQGGCTEDQTPFMRKKKLQANLGGCVIWIKQNELGIFTSVKVEWIPFYDKKFYKYIW